MRGTLEPGCDSQQEPAMNLRRNRLVRQLQARPRLFIASAVGLLTGFAIPDSVAMHGVTRALIGWNVALALYLVLAGVMMARSSHDRMRHRARLQDEGQWVVLTLVMVAAIASLFAVAGQLSVAKDARGALKAAHVGLGAVNVLLSWAFTHTMMALHYAHDYYSNTCRGRPGGLQFPDDDAPDYGDFVYFSAVIGTSGQTADVSFTSKEMRRAGTVHCVIAFLFNTTVLALSINIASGLI